MWCFDGGVAEGAEVAVAEVVAEDDDEVWFFGGCGDGGGIGGVGECGC